jgi:WD40 repeat protein
MAVSIGDVSISDDGNNVAACGTGRWVFYWANAKGRSTSSEAVSWQSIWYWQVEEVDLSSDGDYVAAGVKTSNAPIIYGAAYWKNAKTLTGNPQAPDWLSTEPAGRVIGIAVSDDGNYVAASSYGDSVHYWASAKTLSGNPPSTWKSPTGIYFSDLDMSSDGNSVIAGATDTAKGVYFWAGATGLTGKPQNPNWTFATAGDVVRVVINNAGDYMAAFNDVTGPPRVYFFDKIGNLKWSYDPDNTGFGLSISGDGATLAVGTSAANTGYLLSTGFSSGNLPNPVGGLVIPTNKTEILAPFAALAGLVVAVSAVVAVKRRRD